MIKVLREIGATRKPGKYTPEPESRVQWWAKVGAILPHLPGYGTSGQKYLVQVLYGVIQTVKRVARLFLFDALLIANHG